jgi:peptide subunit release factor RF-3
LHSYGQTEGYDKLVVVDTIVLLIEALKGIGATDNKLMQAHTKADHHNPSSPDAA